MFSSVDFGRGAGPARGGLLLSCQYVHRHPGFGWFPRLTRETPRPLQWEPDAAQE